MGDLASFLRSHSCNSLTNTVTRQALQRRQEGCSSSHVNHRLKAFLPENVVRNFLQQLATALKVCHSKSISHFDLKPQNILLSKKNVFHSEGDSFVILKLADFGFAKHLKSNDEEAEETDPNEEPSSLTVTDLRGTPLYMAPEIIFKSEYDARADLWSVGVILYEILVGRTPFHSVSVKELVQRLKNERIRIPSNVKISPECHDLLVRLLQRNPNRRMSFEDFFSHKFLDLDHMPSLESYQLGCEILSRAVGEDKAGDYSKAIDSYLNGLDYLLPILHFGLPLNDETSKVKLNRSALKTKIQTYIDRAEVLKSKLHEQQKYELSRTEEDAFSFAYEECIHADFLFESQSFRESLDKYQKHLQTLLSLLQKLPEEDRDTFARQVSLWLDRAEEAKKRVKEDKGRKKSPQKKSKNQTENNDEPEEGWVTFSPRQVSNYKRPKRSNSSRNRHNNISDSIGCRVQ